MLWLQGNQLTGGIPPELSSLSGLESLGLSTNRLTGPIPPELGGLTQLQVLWLFQNQLSGPIPWELVNLSNLSTLEISLNPLEGCIPPALRRVTTNDLSSLGLSDCTESGRVPAPDDLSVSLSEGVFSLGWTAVTGAGRYEAQYRITGSADDWRALPATENTTSTYSPADIPLCDTTYEFRVRAYGDASTYAAGLERCVLCGVGDDRCLQRGPLFRRRPLLLLCSRGRGSGRLGGRRLGDRPRRGRHIDVLDSVRRRGRKVRHRRPDGRDPRWLRPWTTRPTPHTC